MKIHYNIDGIHGIYYVGQAKTLSDTNSIYYSNYALNGGIYNLNSNTLHITLTANRYSQNLVQNNGGVLYASSFRTITSKNNEFTENISKKNGAVYYLTTDEVGAVASFTNEKYNNNNATDSGGVAFVTGSDITFIQKTARASQNVAGNKGGVFAI